MNSNMDEIRSRIRACRKKHYISLQELANRTGMSKSTLQRYEMGGIQNLPLDRLEPLAAALHTTPAYLLGWESESGETDLLLSAIEIADMLGLNRESVLAYMESRGFGENLNATEISEIADHFGVQSPDLIGHQPEAKLRRVGVKIPVLGTVAAGIPISAVEDILDYEEITPEMADTGEFFGLKLKGDSMKPRMENGDVVIIRQQPDVESGDVALVLIGEEEATVKKVLKRPDGIVLQPYNPDYEPMFFSPREIEELPVQVIGKVVELRGKL